MGDEKEGRGFGTNNSGSAVTWVTDWGKGLIRDKYFGRPYVLGDKAGERVSG